MKSIIKEVIIVLLLLLAIILVLGVVLYDYVPTNKIVPKVEPYEAPNNVKEELEKSINENDVQTVITYEIDSSDLNIYEKGKDYKKGKVNPFSSLPTTLDNTINNAINSSNHINTNNAIVENTNNTTNIVANNNQTTNTQNPDATGTYFNNTGTK